jgi:hypothetical protein
MLFINNIKIVKLINKMNTLVESLNNLTIKENNNSEKFIEYIFENKETDVWCYIFSKIPKITLNAIEANEIVITAKEIKEYLKKYDGLDSKQKEPRLLCSFTSSIMLPKIFEKFKIYMLSVANGSYLLTTENIFIELYYPIDSAVIEFKKINNSDLLQLGNSEMSYIDNLKYAGVFESINILNEPIIYGSILGGRHRINKFTTSINNLDIIIKGSQFEIDACYESENNILIIEAKNSNKKLKDFNIRQLYYPFRYIKDHTKKNIQTIFINKYNNIYYIWSYKLNDSKINDIKLIKYMKIKLID